MELEKILSILLAEAFFSFWILGNIYTLSRKTHDYFPAISALKMTWATFVGFPLLVIGGLIGSMIIFNYEVEKENSCVLTEALASLIIISITAVILYYTMDHIFWVYLY